MSDILLFTRPDGIKVRIIKTMIVNWSPSIDQRGTQINLLSGFQTVRETPEQIEAAYNA